MAAETNGRQKKTRRANGDGTRIKKHAKGGYYTHVTINRQRITIYGKTVKEVQRKEQERRDQAGTGQPVEPHQMIVNDLLDRWLAECTARGRKPKTLWSYGQTVRLYMQPAIGKVKAVDLNDTHVRKLRDDMLKRGLSPTTVRNTLTNLYSALKFAVRTKVLLRNVAEDVDQPAKVNPSLRPPTPEEMGLLLDAARDANDPLLPLWSLAAFAGCRPGELLGLSWNDVDWDARRVTIRRNLVKIPKQMPFLGEPKTKNGRRVLRLPAEAMDDLRGHRPRQNAMKLSLGEAYGGTWRDADLIFTTHTGTPLLPRNVDRQFKKALARAGLPATIRFYDMRHGNATAMLKAGLPAKVAAERLGHSSVTLFNDTYAHMLTELDDTAADRVHEAIRGKKQAV